jgi:hypothetical protein
MLFSNNAMRTDFIINSYYLINGTLKELSYNYRYITILPYSLLKSSLKNTNYLTNLVSIVESFFVSNPFSICNVVA